MGWIRDNSADTTHPVCQKQRNAYGLCDMSGNVWEWVSDWYGAYPTGSVTDPQGATGGSDRVNRGGSWTDYPAFARAAYRFDYVPGYRYNSLGFRVARSGP